MKDVSIYIYTEYTGSFKTGTGKYHVILETMVMAGGKEITWTTQDMEVIENTTRNRLELEALTKALSHMKKPSRIMIYTTSDYISGAFKQDWLEKWSKNQYMRKGKPVKYAELWKEIKEQAEKHDIEVVKAEKTPYMKVQALELKSVRKERM